MTNYLPLLFFIFVFQVGLASYVLIKGNNKDNEIVHHFVAFTYYMALWVACYIFALLSKTNPYNVLFARLTSFPSLLFPFHFLCFSISMLGRKVNKYYFRIAYVLLVGMGTISIVTDYYVVNTIIYSGGYDYIPGKYYYYDPAIFMFFMLSGVYYLLVNYRQQNKIKQNQLKYLLYSVIMSLPIGFITNIYMPIINLRQLNVVGPLATIIVTTSAAYAITKRNLMDIEVVISRTVAGLVTMFTLSYIYLIVARNYSIYMSKDVDLLFVSITIVYGAIVGRNYNKMRLLIQTSSDKVFLRGRYDYYHELLEISSQISKDISVDNIKTALRRAFHEVVEASNPRIYLLDEVDEKKTLNYRFIEQPEQHDKGLIVPCRAGGRLIGMFVLGPKLSEEQYTQEDVRLINNLANQAAIALDNIRIYKETLAAQTKLMQVDKMASFGRVAASIAHEIKNPLTIVKGMTQAIDLRQENDQIMADYIEVVPKEIARVNNMVNSLLSFDQSVLAPHTMIDLNEIINTTIKIFNTKFEESKIKVVSMLDKMPQIKGNAANMIQVFTNLFMNAVQAMPNGGTLKVRAKVEEGQISIDIIDSGIGIPSQQIKDIFEPFFTTKGGGVGLGLAVCYKIIKDHGADIRVESKVGGGARFNILMPVIEIKPEDRQSTS